jgi:hypothetical protein
MAAVRYGSKRLTSRVLEYLRNHRSWHNRSLWPDSRNSVRKLMVPPHTVPGASEIITCSMFPLVGRTVYNSIRTQMVLHHDISGVSEILFAGSITLSDRNDNCKLITSHHKDLDTPETIVGGKFVSRWYDRSFWLLERMGLRREDPSTSETHEIQLLLVSTSCLSYISV